MVRMELLNITLNAYESGTNHSPAFKSILKYIDSVQATPLLTTSNNNTKIPVKNQTPTTVGMDNHPEDDFRR